MALFSRDCKTSALLVISTTVLIVAIAVKWVAIPLYMQDQVYKNMELIPGTEGYKVWVEPPNEILMKYYFYHVENPDGIKNGEKPRVREVGPYVYNEYRRKENIVAVGDEELQFGQYIWYVFDEEATMKSGCINPITEEPCRKSDNVTIINSSLAGFAELIHGLPSLPVPGLESLGVHSTTDLLYYVINLAVLTTDPPADDLFHTHNVDGILFNGHSPGIVKFIFLVIDTIETALNTYLNGTITLDLDQYLPPQLQDGNLAFFRGKNATLSNQYFRINRGRNEPHKFTMIELLNGEPELPKQYWPDIPISPSAMKSGIKDTCHYLHGTDGVYFPAFMDKNYPIWLYVSDLCRSVYAVYDTEVEVKGIKAWRYRAAKDLLLFDQPENLCYCRKLKNCIKPMENGEDRWDLSDCEDRCLDGTLYAQGCLGVPIISTAPHFFQADPSLAEAIDGLTPDQEKHDTFLDVDPITGVAMTAYKKGQINVQLRPNDIMKGFKDLQTVIFPVFWADEGAVIDDENADMYKGMVTTPLLVVDIFIYFIGIACSILGIIVALIFKVKLLLEKRRAEKED